MSATCPKCGGENTRIKASGLYECRTCSKYFLPKRRSGSGVIAPRTYRAQIASELLGKLEVTGKGRYYGK